MTQRTRDLINKLSRENLIDGVGVEMILFSDQLPSTDDIAETLRGYSVPVYITEFQVVMTNFRGAREQRYFEQARIYRDVVEAILNSGNSNTIIFFNQSDKVSARKAEFICKLPPEKFNEVVKGSFDGLVSLQVVQLCKRIFYERRRCVNDFERIETLAR